MTHNEYRAERKRLIKKCKESHCLVGYALWDHSVWAAYPPSDFPCHPHHVAIAELDARWKAEQEQAEKKPMDDLLERAKEIIHDLMDCPEQSKEFWARVHQWASDSDLAAHKPQGPLRLRFCKRNGGWEWIIESIDGWDTRELAISDARRFVEKIGAGIEVENE